MPSTTEAQARLMAGIAHGWHPTGLKHAPSQAVAQEFNQADKGSALLSHAMQHHADGGSVDPLDFSARYNTPLTADQEHEFQTWAQHLGAQGSSYDYDLRGA